MSGHGGTLLQISAGDTIYIRELKKYSDAGEKAFVQDAKAAEAQKLGCKPNEVRIGKISRPSKEPSKATTI